MFCKLCIGSACRIFIKNLCNSTILPWQVKIQQCLLHYFVCDPCLRCWAMAPPTIMSIRSRFCIAKKPLQCRFLAVVGINAAAAEHVYVQRKPSNASPPALLGFFQNYYLVIYLLISSAPCCMMTNKKDKKRVVAILFIPCQCCEEKKTFVLLMLCLLGRY